MELFQTILDILVSAAFWPAVLRIATPYILGTLGELLCERAGVLNLGIEGIMTMGAMAGWMAVYQGADLWTGVLVAALCGGLMGLLHATLTVPLGLSQHVAGIGVTLLGTTSSTASSCPKPAPRRPSSRSSRWTCRARWPRRR